MNFGEELGYWYLRLNGCFPVVDYVLHGGVLMERTSDCDLLAVRPPNVFEEVGGQKSDWDPVIAKLANGRTLGVICEVKTGRYDVKKLFPPNNIAYAVKRLGLIADYDEAISVLQKSASFDSGENIRIAKLFVASGSAKSDRFIFISISHVRDFFRRRFSKYKEVKFRDRHFFPSELIQNIIDELHGTTRLPERNTKIDFG